VLFTERPTTSTKLSCVWSNIGPVGLHCEDILQNDTAIIRDFATV